MEISIVHTRHIGNDNKRGHSSGPTESERHLHDGKVHHELHTQLVTNCESHVVSDAAVVVELDESAMLQLYCISKTHVPAVENGVADFEKCAQPASLTQSSDLS